MFANIKQVGMPTWSEADQTLAKGIQRELGQKNPRGLSSRVADSLQAPQREADMRGGGSDDIGDVSWNVPTVTLSYPSNIPGLPGHNWANAIAMATPIAHKGVTAGAKVQAMTMLDLMTKPAVVTQAWDYFKNVQTKETKYFPLDAPDGQAGDLAEQGDHGQVSPGDAEVLLRSDEVQDVPGAVGDQVPDGARYDEDRSVAVILASEASGGSTFRADWPAMPGESRSSTRFAREDDYSRRTSVRMVYTATGSSFWLRTSTSQRTTPCGTCPSRFSFAVFCFTVSVA